MNKLSIILSLLLISVVLKETVCNSPRRLLKHKPHALANAQDTAAVHKDVKDSRGTKRHVPKPDYPETGLTDAAIAADGKEYSNVLKKYVKWTSGTDAHFKGHFSKTKPTNPF